MGISEEGVDKATEKAMETAMKASSALYGHIDFCVEQAENDIFGASVPATEKTTNHFKTMHAAVQFAVA